MGRSLVTLLLRRPLKRWRTPGVLLLMAVLLWLAFLSTDKLSGNPMDDTNKQKLKSINVIKSDVRLALDDKVVDSDSAKDGEFLHEEIAMPPMARRGPVPVIYDMAVDTQPQNEEENAAREEVDVLKEPENLKLDDNAAREEHSGEAVMPGVGHGHLGIGDGDTTNKLGVPNGNTANKLGVPNGNTANKLDVPNVDTDHELRVPNGDTANELKVPNSDTANELHVPNGSAAKELHASHMVHDQKQIVETKKSSEKIQVAEDIREQEESFHQLPEHQKDLPEEKYGLYNNWRNLTGPEIGKLSVLGRRLFLNEKVGQEQNRTFTIHIWKYLKYIEKRLFYRYGKEAVNPFEECSVSNCKITSQDDQVTEADAVLFHLHRIDLPPANVPRKKGQLWVWLSDESPYNLFMVAKDRHLAHYSGYFNWSMTYRIDSDVPVPYGRTVPLPKDQYLDKVDNMYSTKEKDIAILGSNCSGKNGRYKYIKDLQKFISVDMYGGCGPLKCEGHFKKDCPKLDQYKFYLAFENSNCDDYITEKVWWNALHKGAVPVVMGATKSNYMRVLPPGSFIYAEDFHTPKHLAEYLKYLLENPKVYEEYHSWRRWYRVLNEHGYFQSPVHHLCRLCEALNYNSRPKEGATSDLLPYFDSSQHCHPATWKPS